MSDGNDTNDDEKQMQDLHDLTMVITHSQSNDAGSSPSAHGLTASSTPMQQPYGGSSDVTTTADGNIGVKNRISPFHGTNATEREKGNITNCHNSVINRLTKYIGFRL